jgi:hypothetical protein
MDSVIFAIDGPVATVTINRPAARNAVDRPTADALAAAFRLRRRRRPPNFNPLAETSPRFQTSHFAQNRACETHQC